MTVRVAQRYLVDVRDLQRRVDQPFVHGVFGVFAFLVQVHCLQTQRRGGDLIPLYRETWRVTDETRYLGSGGMTGDRKGRTGNEIYQNFNRAGREGGRRRVDGDVKDERADEGDILG